MASAEYFDKSHFFELLAEEDVWQVDNTYSKIINEFDNDSDGCLNKFEFETFLENLFYKKDTTHRLTDAHKLDLMSLLDGNKDGKICPNDFKLGVFHWLQMVMKPVSALIVIDVQNDFIDGSLCLKSCPAGQDGVCVVPVINQLLDNVHFDVVIYSRDWHPQDHISFIENVANRQMDSSSQVCASSASTFDTVIFEGPPVTEQKLWPEHCVQETVGAQLHKDLTIAENSVVINKGMNSDIDSYSAFWDNSKLSQTGLVKELTKRHVTDVYCCGIAYDVCVGSTAFHSLEHGFRTILIEDASRGVSLEDIDKTRAELKSKGAIIAQSSEVPDLVSGQDRRPELALQAAVNIALARKLADTGMRES